MQILDNICQSKEKPYIFISYSHEDSDRVYPILDELKENGYRFWCDYHIDTGAKWAEDIHEWLTHENCSKFVVFISKNSVASEYVEDEVNLARKYRKSCLVIYLENVKLSGTMELLLDRWQSINQYEKCDETFIRMLMKGIPVEAIDMSQSSTSGTGEFASKYKILEVIGNGGSSTVYKAEMISTGAIVTIKVANCRSSEENPRNILIQNEKIALAKIQSPFIPKIIDFGESLFDNELKYYLVESYIPGQTLGKIRCPLSEMEIVMIILDIARTLQYLHINGNNFVHCDIKPDNIIIDEFNRSYLIDFGGCVCADSQVSWGTTTFSAPEQCNGEKIDLRSDIYSLGVTMKYLLAKDYLREKGTTFKVFLSQSLVDTIPTVSFLLALIVDKMTDPRTERRFQTLEELINTVEEFKNKLDELPELILQKNYRYQEITDNWKSQENPYEMIYYTDPLTDRLAHSAIINLSVSMPTPTLHEIHFSNSLGYTMLSDEFVHSMPEPKS